MTGVRSASARTLGIFLCVLALSGIAIGVAIDQVRGPAFESSTAVLIRTWSVDSLLLTGQPSPVTSQDQADAAVVAVSEPVLTRAASKLGANRTWNDLATMVSATPEPTSHFVSITATAPDPGTSLQVSEAVANAFVAVQKEQLVAMVSRLAPPQDDPALGFRVQLLTGPSQQLQVYNSSPPEKLRPGLQTPAALGIVGLAIGALVVVTLTLTRPTVTRPRDVQRLVSLPAVGFEGPEGGEEASRLVGRLLDGRPRGVLMVCPVDGAAEETASELADWTRRRSGDSTDGLRVVLMPEPTGTVLGTRPNPAHVAAMLLVVPQGTASRVLSDAVALLAPWRAADAVIVTA